MYHVHNTKIPLGVRDLFRDIELHPRESGLMKLELNLLLVIIIYDICVQHKHTVIRIKNGSYIKYK